ncbi:MAG: class I SAM-dependent methyltransferase [Planctomycetota bacterium]
MPLGLTGGPETMLWTLHNRANEAMREGGILDDARAIEVYRAIDYDYLARFGRPEPSHAVRSLVFDEQVQAFLSAHPDGVIINLGEGLETQRYRVASPRALWVSVDLPEAIAVREQFIPADEQHVHVACSATDPAWLNQVPRDRPVMITAQGLFMYFDESTVAETVAAAAEAFPGGVLVFDTVPAWFANKTTRPGGWRWTPTYTMPPMPWGVNRNRIAGVVRGWSPRIESVEEVPFFTRWPRGIARWLAPTALATPILGRYGPAVTLVRFGEA